jgi:hypothetical protein
MSKFYTYPRIDLTLLLGHIQTENCARHKKVKGKCILVRGRGGPYGCEKSRFPHFLDNWLTDGGVVVSLTRRPPLIPQEYSWYSFLIVAESPSGP